MNYTVSIKVSFCYGHRIVGHPGKCANLHGHTGTVEVRVRSSKLNELGMVTDFGPLKEQIKEYVDAMYDHKMVLEQGDPIWNALYAAHEKVATVLWKPTAEHFAKDIFDFCVAHQIPVHAVRFWESDTTFAEVRR